MAIPICQKSAIHTTESRMALSVVAANEELQIACEAMQIATE
ncbi:hypothetical protein [Botrimarina colliarenosi]|nr:hypothetical protein [Botrimarina colliarenosi]